MVQWCCNRSLAVCMRQPSTARTAFQGTAFQEGTLSTRQWSKQSIWQAMAIGTLHNRWRHVQSAHDALACRLDLALARSQTKPPEFISATFVGGFL